MSQTDSFIEEVTEEVRRDRLFRLMRRYGWIAVLAVLLLVGGAALNEWRKSQAEARAQATGDAILAAMQADEPQARVDALASVETHTPGAQAVVDMLRAAELVADGQAEAAAGALDSIATDGELPEIYRDMAGFKSALLAETLGDEERRLRLEGLVSSGSPLRLQAEEQLALMDIAAGAREDAIERLQRIMDDSMVTSGLRRRASRLMLALGAEDAAAADTAVPGTGGGN
ncbi:MAG: hypothetical protein FH759_05525 [Sediminimonas qiaohouensis]|uniref:Tetratricopeptide repeat protein n=1 Tax=Sediminimonas qiaohouensis TaxID=552061 RepID=A0A7C9LMN4_9RHOB|nr:hypothetical protein [Sediminimonas qiaohouensis]MTJ04142.1 hypothetical protein [Sediminimonas qiaohouensis]